MKALPVPVFLLLSTAFASGAGSERTRLGVADPDHHEMVESFTERLRRGATYTPDNHGMVRSFMDWITFAAEKRQGGVRPGLPEASALDNGVFEQEEDECRLICEEDVLDNDVCIGTPTNPVPSGKVWMFSRDTRWSFGCCAFGLGACKECCPPTEDDRLAFQNADDALLVQSLFEGMGTDIENFDSEDSPNNPFEPFSGVCLTLNDFTILEPGNLPISRIMQAIVNAGYSANGNGRSRNGFFITDGLYYEMSQLSFLEGGSITYRILGYDYGGQSPGSRRGNKRIVELPWQLAPHGEAMYTTLEENPEEYGDDVKLAYHLISPYLGDILVKMECCTQEELTTYERVSDSSYDIDILATPVPPVRYTTTPQQCQQMRPAFEF
mmetsp:Transcript_14112/g.30161  ORF Transcript_14112/g.30161 Transcript_14112/m.30161 type:complete len:382 (+) Transcript_14112:197-1342(+)|eukprot:CAMPEP_0196141564 /NCGR_PEP_ID=MMETSP0910-20130528/9958_1 /TAXON_ID=49265 /ORGANISM="Thalassiosira rotula, Strain GSO102" /LENGTH=381 /DNA_ID=CAMNT_0041402731 /DNA_START=132 /DNA_END=1277 /DNA_ORIENTATION=-